MNSNILKEWVQMENKDHLLPKIKIAVRKGLAKEGLGNAYQNYEFKFWRGFFYFKSIYKEGWGGATAMIERSFFDGQDEDDFNDSIKSIVRNIFYEEKLYNRPHLKPNKRVTAMQQRKLMRKALQYQKLNKRYGR